MMKSIDIPGFFKECHGRNGEASVIQNYCADKKM